MSVVQRSNYKLQRSLSARCKYEGKKRLGVQRAAPLQHLGRCLHGNGPSGPPSAPNLDFGVENASLSQSAHHSSLIAFFRAAATLSKRPIVLADCEPSQSTFLPRRSTFNFARDVFKQKGATLFTYTAFCCFF